MSMAKGAVDWAAQSDYGLPITANMWRLHPEGERR